MIGLAFVLSALVSQSPVATTTGYEVKVGETTIRCFVYDVQHKRLFRADGVQAQAKDLADIPRIDPQPGLSQTPKLAIIVRAVGGHSFAGVPWVDVLGHGLRYMDANTTSSSYTMSSSYTSLKIWKSSFTKPHEKSSIDFSALPGKTVAVEFHFSPEWKTVGSHDVKTG